LGTQKKIKKKPKGEQKGKKRQGKTHFFEEKKEGEAQANVKKRMNKKMHEIPDIGEDGVVGTRKGGGGNRDLQNLMGKPSMKGRLRWWSPGDRGILIVWDWKRGKKRPQVRTFCWEQGTHEPTNKEKFCTKKRVMLSRNEINSGGGIRMPKKKKRASNLSLLEGPKECTTHVLMGE